MRRTGVVLALVAGLLGLGAAAAAPTTAQAAATDCATRVLEITEAEAELHPDGGPARVGRVDLARRWDLDFPGRGGSAAYRIALPPCASDGPLALLFSRVGNQARVSLNGVVVERLGSLGDPGVDTAKTARIVHLPAALLHVDRPNELRIDTTIQAQRWGGLSVLMFGPQEAIDQQYAQHFRWRFLSPLISGLSLLAMGSLAVALWWRQRDPVYGTFGAAALLGVVRNLDRVWPDVPVPWPLWGAVVAVCYALHLALICRFTLGVLGQISPRMTRFITAVMVAAASLAIASFALQRPLLWTLGLATLVPLGVISCALVIRLAWREGSTMAWVLTGAGLLAVAAGVHDLGLVRVQHASGLVSTYTPEAMFVFVLIMAGMVVDRYSRTVFDFRALNADLTRRVDERERQLSEAFDALRERDRTQAMLDERQRIMREIHDGVGSQLVGLLNLVHQRGVDPAELEDQVKAALDEMRMAVDSMQPVHGDLATVLATLRYRLQPRLEAAGIQLQWDVQAMPAMPQLTPHAVLQVQRLLLEAFTNVLRHAQARRIHVWAGPDADDPTRASLCLTDDGVGLPGGVAPSGGQGLANMRHRAAALNGQLHIAPGPHGGTRVCLSLPTSPPAA